MLFLPKGGLPPKKNKMGYARGHGPSGHWLRARASVVNTNTDGMSRWRHLFNVAKINFKATQPGGRNTAPVLGITPFEAWLYQSATYVGIVLAGLYEGGIQLMQTLIGCSSVEAYEVMVSTTLAQMNQPTPIAPPITTVKATATAGGGPATAGTATLTVATGANAQVGPISAVFSAALTISGFTMPTPPTPSGDPWYTAGTQITQFAMLPNSVAPGSLMLPWALLADVKPGSIRFHRHRPARRRHLLPGRHRTSRHPLARLADGRSVQRHRLTGRTTRHLRSHHAEHRAVRHQHV